jgi:cytochrome c oxidase assembly factor CtaG
MDLFSRAALFLHPISLLQDGEESLPTPTTLWDRHNWTWEASITIPLFILLFWYVLGVFRRGDVRRLRLQHAAFFTGWLALFFALVSPLHRLGDVLFSAHMLQHEILILISAPLMAASHPAVTLLYAFPGRHRPSMGGLIARFEKIPLIALLIAPFGAFVVHAVALWAWHIPYLYQATVRSDIFHAAQHLSFFLSGLLFWSALYGAGRSTMSYGAGVLYVFGTATHCGALGALLTFSNVLWYPIYQNRTEVWRLTPLQDQQLGGLLMWVPSGVVFIAVGIWLFAKWLAASETRLRHSTLGAPIPDE